MLVRQHDYHISEITFASLGQGLSAQRAHPSHTFRGLFPFLKALSLSLPDAVNLQMGQREVFPMALPHRLETPLPTPGGSAVPRSTALVPAVTAALSKAAPSRARPQHLLARGFQRHQRVGKSAPGALLSSGERLGRLRT